jgi:hypothetical protein
VPAASCFLRASCTTSGSCARERLASETQPGMLAGELSMAMLASPLRLAEVSPETAVLESYQRNRTGEGCTYSKTPL